MKTDEIIGVLERAATVIEQNGWTRAQMVSPNGEHCLSGAVRHALGMCTRHQIHGNYDASTAVNVERKITNYLCQHRRFTPDVATWNDRDCDGAEEAILLLKEMAYDLARE